MITERLGGRRKTMRVTRGPLIRSDLVGTICMAGHGEGKDTPHRGKITTIDIILGFRVDGLEGIAMDLKYLVTAVPALLAVRLYRGTPT